jgi:hypothetical protein
MSIADGNPPLKVILRGTSTTEFSVQGKAGWNNFTSPPLELGEGPDLSVTFATQGKPIRLSPNDPRIAAFVIKDAQILQEQVDRCEEATAR